MGRVRLSGDPHDKLPPPDFTNDAERRIYGGEGGGVGTITPEEAELDKTIIAAQKMVGNSVSAPSFEDFMNMLLAAQREGKIDSRLGHILNSDNIQLQKEEYKKFVLWYYQEIVQTGKVPS